jgi:hypothetical protein
VSRSPELNPEEQPLELRRGFSQLNIYLPLGSPEGAYEVRIVTASGDSLLNTGGTAQLRDGVTALVTLKRSHCATWSITFCKFGKRLPRGTLTL